MALMPHDITDLALAPVVLRVEREIGSYSGLSQEEVLTRVAEETDRQPRTAPARRDAVLRALTQYVDLHGWEAHINERGLRLSHGRNDVTLGLPPSLRAFLAV